MLFLGTFFEPYLIMHFMHSDMNETILSFLNKNNYDAITPKAVLFDMDGVLFDSMKNHALSWYRTVMELGIPCTREEFYLYEGQTGRQTINQLIQRGFGREATDSEKSNIYARKTAHFNSLPAPEVMPGAVEVLKLVKEMGLIPVLVTGSGQKSLIGKIETNFPGIFVRERMITAHDVHQGKPHPEPYLRGLEKAGVKPEEALVIENAPLGVRSAATAGIFTIAVNTGPLSEKLLYDEGAQIVLSGMPELAACFGEILKLLQETKRQPL